MPIAKSTRIAATSRVMEPVLRIRKKTARPAADPKVPGATGTNPRYPHVAMKSPTRCIRGSKRERSGRREGDDARARQAIVERAAIGSDQRGKKAESERRSRRDASQRPLHRERTIHAFVFG